MNNANNASLIMSVKEFRKLVGKEAESFSDDEIIDLISGLDFMAELFIKQGPRKDKMKHQAVPKST